MRMGAVKEKALGEGRQSSACLLPGGLSSRSPSTGMRAVRVYSAAVCAGIWGLLLLLNFQIQSTKGPLVVRDSRKHVGMAMEEYAPQPRAVPGGSGMAVQPPALPIPPSSTRPGASSAGVPCTLITIRGEIRTEKCLATPNVVSAISSFLWFHFMLLFLLFKFFPGVLFCTPESWRMQAVVGIG